MNYERLSFYMVLLYGAWTVRRAVRGGAIFM